MDGKGRVASSGKIQVPFSPETQLSGVKFRMLQPEDTLEYTHRFTLEKVKKNKHLIIHFGAVDQTTTVYINDKLVGEHDGGYHPFYFDITNYITDITKTEILVKVIDNYSANGAAFGKQGDPRRRIFYQKIGGIWQTVWIESVPNKYIQDVKITPNYDDHSVSFYLTLPENNDNSDINNTECEVKILNDNKETIASGKILPYEETNISLPNDFRSWSPEDPYLYKVEYTFDKDIVKSYFGMRKFSIGIDQNNIKRLFLNNKPYFQNGVLDQGFWSDGIYTAPSDEALIYDIKIMKNLGFNMLRKHIKIEPLRWYYHCDTLGMLVWQDQPSGGSYPYNKADESYYYTDDDYEMYNRTSEIGRLNFIRDIKRTLNLLYNSPCISTWVPFNEGWGQFDALKSVDFIKELDTSRYIDHASGFHDQYGGDFYSLHIYFGKIDFGTDKYGRVHALSEFGGYSYVEEGHCGSDHHFGYFKYETKEDLNKAYKELIVNNVIPEIPKGLSATVYTQLSDVEDEVNGIITYDRKVVKLDTNMVKELNSHIQFSD